MLSKILFVPDTHAPFEDHKAWNLMLKAAQAWRPDTIVILGDFFDFYCVSAHDKRPDRARMLKQEIQHATARLDELDALGARFKHYVLGNHEDRLDRYLMTHAPELWGLVNVRELFGLTERGWRMTPYKQALKLGKLFVTHDAGNAGAYAHIKASETFEGNVVIGHTHRMGVHYKGSARGEAHVGAMFGWLGDVNKIDYMHRINALRAWQLGFGIGRMEPGGVVHLQAVPIVRNRCVVEGELFSL